MPLSPNNFIYTLWEEEIALRAGVEAEAEVVPKEKAMGREVEAEAEAGPGEKETTKSKCPDSSTECLIRKTDNAAE